MSLPGVVTTTRSQPPVRGRPTATGTFFIGGLADWGPTDTYAAVRNMSDVERIYGPRDTAGYIHDAAEGHFREGAILGYISRGSGPTPVRASRTLVDRAGSPVNTLKVWARYAGERGNDFEVTVADGDADDTFVLTITDSADDDAVLAVSGDLASPTEAVAWALTTDVVTIDNLASVTAAPDNNPAVASATALTGGTDDRGSMDDDDRTDALDRFPKSLGPGQVSWPGGTTDAIHEALAAHAATRNRHALLDAPDSATVATLTASAEAVRDTPYASFASMYAPWVVVPGVVPNTTRRVPPSAIVGGLMARGDANGGTNVPAAGDNGLSLWVRSLGQVSWSDADRETLNDGGINVIRDVYDNGTFQLYGYRTTVDPDGEEAGWLAASNSRLRMEISNRADIVGDGFAFDQIDGAGLKIAEWGGALKGMLLEYWEKGSLYGVTPDEAFVVDVGPAINTEESLAALKLRAAIAVRMSPFAEMVEIDITKVAITDAVAA